MPSNSSEIVLPLYSAGILNSVRYHHGWRNGLDGGIWMFEKSSNIGYVVPGSERRFIPTYGAEYTWSSTRALRTVDGRVAGYQPCIEKPGLEIVAPSDCASADDWMNQFSRSKSRELLPLTPAPDVIEIATNTLTRLRKAKTEQRTMGRSSK